MRALFLFTILLFLNSTLFSQKFWFTTYSFPGGYKNSIEKIHDSLILVSTDHSLLVSSDKGINWDIKLYASKINCIYYSKNNRVFLGGSGKIFYSDNLSNWDSLSLPTGHQVLQFAENNSAIYLITGGFNNVQGYVGDGIFKSQDNGLTWQKKNNGLGSILSSQFIKVDKYNRLIVAFADNYISNQSGIYISSDDANSWQRVLVKVDGKGSISSDELRIEDFTNLSITTKDSVVISFDGTAVNVGVRLNLTKHIDDLLSNNFWKQIIVSNTNTWWMDRTIGPLHIAQNGDWYSSIQGTINTGGSLYSQFEGREWVRHQYGLGLDHNGMFNSQKFVEMSNGRIYMIQIGDERVYFTDTSMSTGVDDNYKPVYNVYPNPVNTNEELTLNFDNSKIKTIEIYNSNPQLIHQQMIKENSFKYIFEKSGLYLIRISEGTETYFKKVIVN